MTWLTRGGLDVKVVLLTRGTHSALNHVFLVTERFKGYADEIRKRLVAQLVHGQLLWRLQFRFHAGRPSRRTLPFTCGGPSDRRERGPPSGERLVRRASADAGAET